MQTVILNKELLKVPFLHLQNWFIGNNSYHRIFTKKPTPNRYLYLWRSIVQESSSVKFLEGTLDNGLTRLLHIIGLCGKLIRVSFALRTLYPLLHHMMLYFRFMMGVLPNEHIRTNFVTLWSLVFPRSSHTVLRFGAALHMLTVFLEQERVIWIMNGLPPLRTF